MNGQDPPAWIDVTCSSLNGYTEIPKTGGATLSATMRYMSGSPFSIFNSNIDVDQNGELTDPSPAGTYSGTAAGNILMTGVKNKGGRNGAIGPDYFQLDLRAGWRGKLRKEDRAIEIFLDIFNITNRANFNNPSGDERAGVDVPRVEQPARRRRVPAAGEARCEVLVLESVPWPRRHEDTKKKSWCDFVVSCFRAHGRDSCS